MGKVTRPLCAGISISQKGFGAATGGTLGCFVQDCETNRMMLLSNMHVLQFFNPSSSLSSIFGGKNPLQNSIVQPCAIEIKNMAERAIGTNKKAVYDNNSNETTPLLPTQREIDDFYNHTINEYIDSLSDLCTIAEYSRGYLADSFDAAVATLTPGTMWKNVTPDGTPILAPPQDISHLTPNTDEQFSGRHILPRAWKYGDASGSKKWGVVLGNSKAIQVPFKTFNFESNHYGALPDKNLFKNAPITFKDVLLIRGENEGAFQIQGDSGSALCDDQNRLIGLMSTGGVGSEAYAIPINVVFSKLNVRFPDTTSGIA